jgi:hypothetical protein
MHAKYQARWISRQRIPELRKSGALGRGMLLDTFKGYIIVEPAGNRLGDGEVLSPQDAEFELQPVWCLEPSGKLMQARRLLGLDVHAAQPVSMAS